MKSRRKHSFQFMTILYFVIVFCMCVSRFNVIMTIMGGQLTRVEEINLLPFHSVRENLQYGRNPISWDMLYNMVMFVPFGIIYCYYQKHFRVYKAVGMSCLTTFFIESAQFILKTGVVDIDDFIVKTFFCFQGKDLPSSLIWFYLIPTPILAKTSRRASAAAATIQTVLYNGFSNKRGGTIKQYNTSLLRTAIFMSCNSSLLQ